MSRIVVKNLPNQGVNVEDIKKHFADIDTVTDVTLKYNDFGVFRRFAFVGFKSSDSAEKAIDKLDKTFIRKSRIFLEPCKAIKESKSSGNLKRKDGNNDPQNTKHPDGDDKSEANKKRSKRGHKDLSKNIFEGVEDEPEFKEFLNLQRNLGENIKSRQIWSDDAKLDAENTVSNVDARPESLITSIKQQDIKQNPDTVDDGQKLLRKRHKRSRGKKTKPTKTKPVELFVHTAKISGYPPESKRKDIKIFFKPLELLSIRMNKKDGVCYVSFKDESDLKFALRENLKFWGTSRIRMWRHNVKRSRVFKEQVKEKVKHKEETIKRHEKSLADVEPVEESGRLFVRNLNYTCVQEDLEQVFSKYGELTEVHMPLDKTTSMPKGYAYVEFMFPKDAARAYEELNGSIFQGRNFHLIPSKPKPEPRFPGVTNDKLAGQSSFKRDKLNDQKQSAPKGANWNILFLGQNPLADVVSNIKGVEKSKLLTQQSRKEPIAVRMALGDAMVVEEMRKFLVSNGIELDSFDNPQAPRSKTVVIVKNLPASTTKTELNELFEVHGHVGRVILPPNGLTAIVEMDEAVEAKLAFKKLAYSKFKDSVLYLEWAPINVFREKSLDEQEVSELKQMEELQTGTKILIKNIPFEATLPEVRKIFATYGEMNFVRIPKKIDGQHRGFGFVDYLTKEDALRAFRALCHSTHLYGRKLVLEWAKVEGDTSVPAPPLTGANNQPCRRP